MFNRPLCHCCCSVWDIWQRFVAPNQSLWAISDSHTFWARHWLKRRKPLQGHRYCWWWSMTSWAWHWLLLNKFLWWLNLNTASQAIRTPLDITSGWCIPLNLGCHPKTSFFIWYVHVKHHLILTWWTCFRSTTWMWCHVKAHELLTL